LNKCGRFGGIRVWNRDQDNQITFVADIDFDELRAFSWHVLTMMREQRADLPLRDPEDPMVEVEVQRANPAPPRLKVPRLNRDIWEHLLKAHNGDAGAAKTTLDRLLKDEADRLCARGRA
jgi:hypothetical protein